MRLPDAPSNYDPVYESEKNNILEKIDQQNFKRLSDVEIGSARLIIESPNGTRYKIVVDDSGNLSASSV
tara:strand:- start:164 stop:370 length:207 start_codon:yes stop_codon:yes gene_type:complete